MTQGARQAQAGDTVHFHYTGTLADGSVFDSSEGREPLSFTLGSGQIIRGLDAAITGMAPVYTRPDGYAQMAIAPLPPQPDLAAFKERLYDDYAVEIPCPAWQGRHFLRISVQGYNSEADLRRLEDAVQTLLVPAQ